MPLLLLYALRAEKEGGKVIVPLAVIMAGAWLTNVPAAVMMSYSLGLLFAILAVQRRSFRVLWYGASAVLLGGALAAFYILPATYEQRWVNIAQALSPGVRPLDNFLLTNTGDTGHDRFNLLISLVALAEILTLAVSVFFSQRWLSASADDRADSVFRKRLLIVWAAAVILLMFRFTFREWETLPELRFVQFPWRWLLCLNVTRALFLAATWKRLRWRILLYLAPFLVAAVVWPRLPRPSWQGTVDIAKMLDRQRSGQGYEGVDEYVPTDGDAYEIKQGAPLVSQDGGGVQSNIQQWSAESRVLKVHGDQPETLVLRLFYYPAWSVEVNGQLTKAQTNDTTGQMMIPIPAGEDQVSLTFTRTWDRTAGGVVSLGALLALLLPARRRPLSHRSQLSSSELSS